jgi:hypothetical protein
MSINALTLGSTLRTAAHKERYPFASEYEGLSLSRVIVLAVLSALMAACESEAEIIARDRARCAAIGFVPDTPDFRECVLRFQTARIQGIYTNLYWGR